MSNRSSQGAYYSQCALPASLLPIIITWQKSKRNLILSLGFGLFSLVGLRYMLVADYMPLAIRIPHTLEILTDSFVHAGLLVTLLAGSKAAHHEALQTAS